MCVCVGGGGGEGGDAVKEEEKERGGNEKKKKKKKTKEEKPAFISKWHVKAQLLPNNKEAWFVGIFLSVADWIAD